MSLKCFTPTNCVTHQDGGCSSSVQLLCVKYKFEKESHYLRMSVLEYFLILQAIVMKFVVDFNVCIMCCYR